MNKEKTVVIGMSGGVDSSVAAYLLKEKGYNVIGVTMEMWHENKCDSQDNGACGSSSAVEDARRVAQKLGIPYQVINFKEEFERDVIGYFIDSYRNGLTPNPCVMCNRKVKWESLLSKGMSIGADYIATGHYARVVKLENGRYTIKQSKTIAKDQTYALCKLTQEQLSRTLMPVGEYSKDEIREIAQKIDLTIADKPDSQDICFVEDGDYVAFMEKYSGLVSEPGDFVDINGNFLGRHKGIVNYTIGQRRGLGISAASRLFVLAIDLEKNQVVLGRNEDTFSSVLRATDVNMMGMESLKEKTELMAKIRYRHKPAKCLAYTEDDGTLVVEFDEPQRAISRGQAVVLYKDDYVVAGATII